MATRFAGWSGKVPCSGSSRLIFAPANVRRCVNCPFSHTPEPSEFACRPAFVSSAALYVWLLGDCVVYGSPTSKQDSYRFHTQLFLDGALLLTDAAMVAESVQLDSVPCTRSHCMVSAEVLVPSWSVTTSHFLLHWCFTVG
jgi:hypothetical protein